MWCRRKQPVAEFVLHRHGHVADLVKEQRAAVRPLEQPFVFSVCSRKSALAVAEQLGLDELLRKVRAVEFHERPAGARRPLMNLPRRQGLPRARLARNQDVEGETGDALDVGLQLARFLTRLVTERKRVTIVRSTERHGSLKLPQVSPRLSRSPLRTY
ncbi:MAG TPA: hypothetical protein VF546_05100 [Pyrinomonadaceae bacterium]